MNHSDLSNWVKSGNKNWLKNGQFQTLLEEDKNDFSINQSRQEPSHHRLGKGGQTPLCSLS